MKYICGCCKSEIESQARNFLGEVVADDDSGPPTALAVLTNSKNDPQTFASVFGIWNQREKKSNWICGACLCEKLGIAERNPRGGYF